MFLVQILQWHVPEDIFDPNRTVSVTIGVYYAGAIQHKSPLHGGFDAFLCGRAVDYRSRSKPSFLPASDINRRLLKAWGLNQPAR